MTGAGTCCIPARGTRRPSNDPVAERTLDRDGARQVDKHAAAPPAPRAPARERDAIPDRFVRVPAGRALVGTDRPVLPPDGEGPARRVAIEGFRIDPFAVTNGWFARFAAETRHVTDAERYGWSLVFHAYLPPDLAGRELPRVAATPWWVRVEGADWAHPFGPDSSTGGMERHPVVHVSWNDACAFAEWAGGRLPREGEWECAARGGPGGVGDVPYPWGHDEPSDDPHGATRANIWQGAFPEHDTGADGWRGTAPVDAFPPNALGLHQMVGNAWEWCEDAFQVRSLKKDAKRRNAAARAGGERLLKGGSHLCHRSYCHRYRIAARTGAGADTSTGHTGFRIVADG